MADSLTIWVSETDEQPWAWYGGPQQQGWADSVEARGRLGQLDAGSICVIVPGTWVRMFDDNLPPMRAAERQSAAGFSIEDQLAAPLSEQHLALGGDDDPRIAVISKRRMESLRGSLQKAGLADANIYTEYDVLPGDAPLALWQRIIQPGPKGYALERDGEGEGGSSEADEQNPFSVMPEMDFSGALNLAQGEYADKNWQWPGGRALGQLAAMLAAAGLCGLFWLAMEGRALDKQADSLNAQAAALYTQATGKEAPADPARAVTRARRAAPSGGADFMSLSAAFLQGLSQIDGVAIDTIRYDESRRELVLRLIYPGFDAAGRLEAAFETTPGQFSSGAVREQKGSLIGDAVFTMETRS